MNVSKLYKMIHCPVCCCCTVTRDGETYTCAACDEQWQMVTPTNIDIRLIAGAEPKLTSDVHKLTPTESSAGDLERLRGAEDKLVSDAETRKHLLEDLMENDDSFFS